MKKKISANIIILVGLKQLGNKIEHQMMFYKLIVTFCQKRKQPAQSLTAF